MVVVREVPGIPLRHFITKCSIEELRLSISELITLSAQLLPWLKPYYNQEKWVLCHACLMLKTNQVDRYPTHLCLSLSLFLCFLCVHSSKQTNLCVRKTVSLHTIRGRKRALNARTTQNGRESDFCPWGKRVLSANSQYSSNSPLSWSVIQQKNGSIKSWSSPCQVTPRKWVLKLFLFFFGLSWRKPNGLGV